MRSAVAAIVLAASGVAAAVAPSPSSTASGVPAGHAAASEVLAPGTTPPPQGDRFRAAVKPARATPPSLSAGALAAEIRESAKRRMDELAELQRERARLEALVAEVAVARRELAKESALLDQKADAEQAARASGTGEPRRDGGSAGEKSTPATGHDAAPDDAQVAMLAKTVKGMKPDQAAAVFGRLEKPLSVAVLQKLRPADAAAVLGRMPPASAAELFTLMAHAGGAAR